MKANVSGTRDRGGEAQGGTGRDCLESKRDNWRESKRERKRGIAQAHVYEEDLVREREESHERRLIDQGKKG